MMIMNVSSSVLFLVVGVIFCVAGTTNAFVPTSKKTTTSGRLVSSLFMASSMDQGGVDGLFKAGLLSKSELDAAALANKKIRSVKDLGWTKPPKRAGNTRPRHWAWGGSSEKAVQDKPNYDESSPFCVEKWLGLEEFYSIVKDDGAGCR